MVGASSLIGRRLPEALGAPDMAGRFAVCYTSRKPLSCATRLFDLNRPHQFQVDEHFDIAIICCPIWLLSREALAHFKRLGIRRLIAFSSVSRFTKSESSQMSERKVVEKLQQAEFLIETTCAEFGIAQTILRSTLIYDPGRDQNISRIARAIDRLGFFVVCGAAKGKRQPVHAADLARAALQAIDSKVSFNRAYNLSGAEVLTYRDMVKRIFVARGLSPRIFCLPIIFWRLGFWTVRQIFPKRTKDLNIEMALRMNADLDFDHSEASRDFGFTPHGFELR